MYLSILLDIKSLLILQHHMLYSVWVVSRSFLLYLYAMVMGKLLLERQAGFLEGNNYCETGQSIRRETEDAPAKGEGPKDCLIAV